VPNAKRKTLNAPKPDRRKRPLPLSLVANNWKPGQTGNPGGDAVVYSDMLA